MNNFFTTSLKDISKLITSGLTPLRSNLDFWNAKDFYWLKTEQIGDRHIFQTNEFISRIAFDKTSIKVIPKNSISIAMYGEGRTRGSVSIIKSEMTTNQACCNIIIDENKADYNFVYYFLKTQYYNLRALSSGVRKNLNSEDIKAFKISIPKLPTQQKIASVLSALDDKIDLNSKINDNLEQTAKAIYDYWFVQLEFPDENGKPYKSSGGKMIYNEELKREIPEGWKNGEVSDLGEVVGGGTPSREIKDYFISKGTAWITPKDLSQNKGNKFIANGELDVSENGMKNASLRIMPKGTVLLSTRAPIGYLAISQNKVTTNQGFKSFVPNKGFSTEFIYYSIKNLIPTIENNAVGSTFKEISASTLKTIPICLPKNSILKAYDKLITPFFNKQNILENQNKELAKLREWLLPMLMNGQVIVK